MNRNTLIIIYLFILIGLVSNIHQIRSFIINIEFATTREFDFGIGMHLFIHWHGTKKSVTTEAKLPKSRNKKHEKTYNLKTIGELNYLVLFHNGMSDMARGLYWHPDYVIVRISGKIKCQKTIRKWLSPWQSESVDCDKVIHSVNKPITFSSVFDKNQKVYQAVNGDYERVYIEGKSCPCTNFENDPWIQIDLLETVLLTQIGIENCALPEYGLIENFQIKIKTTGEFKMCGEHGKSKEDTHFYVPCEGPARKVILKKIGKSITLLLCQIEVFGKESEDSHYFRPDLHKPVLTSGESSISGRNGNDDDRNTILELESRHNNFFRVDLQMAYQIHHVQIWFINDNNNELEKASLFSFINENEKYECAIVPKTMKREEVTMGCFTKARFIELFQANNTLMRFREFQIYTLKIIKKTKTAVSTTSTTTIIYETTPPFPNEEFKSTLKIPIILSTTSTTTIVQPQLKILNHLQKAQPLINSGVSNLFSYHFTLTTVVIINTVRIFAQCISNSCESNFKYKFF